MKKKQKKRFAKNDTWPFVLRSVRHLHTRVATRKVCPDLCQKWKWCSLRAEALRVEADDDISDTTSDTGTDTDSYYDPSSVDKDPKGCEICRMHVGGKTTYKMVTLGASAGNPCCVTILDAINTWTENSLRKIGSKSLLDLELEHANIELLSLPWFDDAWSLTTMALTPIIELTWETMSDQIRDKDSIQLIIFQPTGTTGVRTPTSNADSVPSHGFPHLPLIAYDTSSLASARQIFDWLDDCRRNHPNCRKGLFGPTDMHANTSSEHYMPKRILEILGHQVVLREHLTSDRQYACLSHSWGPDGVPFQLETSTLGALKQGISISALPKTFRDAVLICMRLGIYLIWIDALCIVQDNISDWKEAVTTMADIYENGFITIAATASTDSNTGCFSSTRNPSWPRKLKDPALRVKEYIRPCITIEGEDHGPLSFLIDDHKPLYGYCPLLRRAWVFQERLLSPRVIHLAACQLIWECKSMWKSQHGDIDMDFINEDCYDELGTKHFPDIGTRYFPFKLARNAWWGVVMDYTALDMTFPKDRLPALAAIVKQIMLTRPGDTYIAGLWKDSMIEDLLWSRLKTNKARTPIPDIPTWSWACMADAVSFLGIDMPRASITNISIKEVGPPGLGSAAGAVITLQCKYCVATLRPKDLLQPFCINHQEMGIHTPNLNISFCFREDFDLSTEPRPLQESERVFIVFLGFGRNRLSYDWAGLVLRQVSSTEFERIGCFEMEIQVDPEPSRRKARQARPADNMEFRIRHSFVYSLPTKEFRIV